MRAKIDNIEPEPMAIIAIVTCEPLYRLAWLINQQLGWNLAESAEISVIEKEHSIVRTFPVYSWSDDVNEAVYHLIQNKSAQGTIEPTIKNIDFWMRIENMADTDSIEAGLKKISEIQIVQKFHLSDLKKTSPILKTPLY